MVAKALAMTCSGSLRSMFVVLATGSGSDAHPAAGTRPTITAHTAAATPGFMSLAERVIPDRSRR